MSFGLPASACRPECNKHAPYFGEHHFWEDHFWEHQLSGKTAA